MHHANANQKKAGVALLIADKRNLRAKKITKDQKGHYIMMKGSIHQEDITMTGIYTPNIRRPKFIKKTLTE